MADISFPQPSAFYGVFNPALQVPMMNTTTAQVAPVVYPAAHPARVWSGEPVKTADDLLRQAVPKQHKQSRKVVRSAFDDLETQNITVSASENGLVWGIFQAYSSHYHLRIRPEDVWFAILVQMSFYINANAEKLRSKFVAHEGQKEVRVTDVGTIWTVDIGRLAVRLTHEMHKHLVDPELRDWVMPNFTTTTEGDTVTAAVLMMGAMQKYFSYVMELTCGIPSVTLLGTRADWVDIRIRLDKLKTFGKESETFGSLLIPILDNFIRTFDDPTDKVVVDFWTKVCHHHTNFSGPDMLSGWLTAFCFWDEKGKILGSKPWDAKREEGVDTFDSSIYSWIKTRDVPAGVINVPVTVDDNGQIYDTTMVAGSVGLQWTSSGKPVDTSNTHYDKHRGTMGENGEFVHNTVKVEISDEPGLDTLQPLTGWWMYWRKSDEELAKLKSQRREWEDSDTD